MQTPIQILITLSRSNQSQPAIRGKEPWIFDTLTPVYTANYPTGHCLSRKRETPLLDCWMTADDRDFSARNSDSNQPANPSDCFFFLAGLDCTQKTHSKTHVTAQNMDGFSENVHPRPFLVSMLINFPGSISGFKIMVRNLFWDFMWKTRLPSTPSWPLLGGQANTISHTNTWNNSPKIRTYGKLTYDLFPII